MSCWWPGQQWIGGFGYLNAGTGPSEPEYSDAQSNAENTVVT